jgi:hypothetical protein
MRSSDDYRLASSIVRGIIHAWDPYSLIHGAGAPADEWDNEIARVVAQVPRIKTAVDAAHAVSRVFSAAFQPEGFTPTHCADVGLKLFDALERADLLKGLRET